MAEPIVILLAGGKSERMGFPKGLIDINGEATLVTQAKSLGEAGFVELILVLGYDFERYLNTFPNLKRDATCVFEGLNLRVVVNPTPKDGPFSSLKWGLSCVKKGQSAFVLPIDVPSPSRLVWHTLNQALLGSSWAAVPVFQGRGGHPVHLSCDFISVLLKLPNSSRLDEQIRLLPERKVSRIQVDDRRIALNENRPEDCDSFCITSQRVVLPEGVKAAYLHIEKGKIKEINSSLPENIPVIDFGTKVIMAGLIDTHTHINEPGRTEWEGFESITKAAAAGGITTIIDMPLNSIPPTVNTHGFQEKVKSATGHLFVDCGFWGGVIPGNEKDLIPLAGAGVFGFKAFLCDSGVPEFPMSDEAVLRRALPILKDLDRPLLVHAELCEGPSQVIGKGYSSYLLSRPPAWEINAIKLMVSLLRECHTRAHVVHLSASDAVPVLEKARSEGLPITVETCPHYLIFTAEEISDGATQFKCAPPIREAWNREKLWDALKKSQIDFVVSDHSPCVPSLKKVGGSFLDAWGGISSLQFMLSLLWTEMKARGFGLPELAQLVCEGPARFAGLGKAKGKISVSYDADLVVFEPETLFELKESEIWHRHRLTPYLGRQLLGKVNSTFVRGKKVLDNGTLRDKPLGRVLLR